MLSATEDVARLRVVEAGGDACDWRRSPLRVVDFEARVEGIDLRGRLVIDGGGKLVTVGNGQVSRIGLHPPIRPQTGFANQRQTPPLPTLNGRRLDPVYIIYTC